MQHTWVKYIFVSACVFCSVLFYMLDVQLQFRKAISKTNVSFSHELLYPAPRRQYLSNGTSLSPYFSTFSVTSSSVGTETSPSTFSGQASYTGTQRLTTLRKTLQPVNGKFISELDISQSLRDFIGKEILQSVPRVFSPDFMNPCWYEDKQLLRCLPYFYVAGMPKSGTTDLLSKINSHPDVMASSKEIQWWTRRRYNGYTFNWYLNTQHSLVQKVTSDGPRIASRLITGDGSASTLWDNHVFDDVDGGPEYTHSDVIRVVQPYAKIIGIFRNPTDRLYSDYKFFKKRQNKSPEIFHSWVVDSIKIFNDCLQHLDARKCTYIFHGYVRLDIGIYNIFVRDWLRVFPRQQLYFLRTDEWTNCTLELRKVYDFLALSHLDDPQITLICNQRKKNTNRAGTKLGPMLPETRTLLDEFYKPFMKDLADALEDTRYTWY